MNANVHFMRRQPPVLQGPVLTPAEYNTDPGVELQGQYDIPDRVRPAHLDTRPARRPVVFFLQPVEWWAMADFVTAKSIIQGPPGIPRGQFTREAGRNNIDVPNTAPYGDYVGAFDGVAPDGLE